MRSWLTGGLVVALSSCGSAPPAPPVKAAPTPFTSATCSAEALQTFDVDTGAVLSRAPLPDHEMAAGPDEVIERDVACRSSEAEELCSQRASTLAHGEAGNDGHITVMPTSTYGNFVKAKLRYLGEGDARVVEELFASEGDLGSFVASEKEAGRDVEIQDSKSVQGTMKAMKVSIKKKSKIDKALPPGVRLTWFPDKGAAPAAAMTAVLAELHARGLTAESEGAGGPGAFHIAARCPAGTVANRVTEPAPAASSLPAGTSLPPLVSGGGNGSTLLVPLDANFTPTQPASVLVAVRDFFAKVPDEERVIRANVAFDMLDVRTAGDSSPQINNDAARAAADGKLAFPEADGLLLDAEELLSVKGKIGAVKAEVQRRRCAEGSGLLSMSMILVQQKGKQLGADPARDRRTTTAFRSIGIPFEQERVTLRDLAKLRDEANGLGAAPTAAQLDTLLGHTETLAGIAEGSAAPAEAPLPRMACPGQPATIH